MNVDQLTTYPSTATYASQNTPATAIQPDMPLDAENKTKSIIIFTVPRATSTLLYRIFSNLVGKGKEYPDGCSLLEPFAQAYHIENHLENSPGFNRQDKWPLSTEDAKRLVLEKVKKGFTIIKELAYQLDDNKVDDDFLAELFQYAEPLFLIRSPDSTIPSGIYPYFLDGNVNQYTEEKTGFQKLHQLFDRTSRILKRPPLLIEAEAYLENPADQLGRYFNELGLSFKQEYLSFTPYDEQDKKNDPAYQVWGDTWYKKAFETTEIKARKVEKCMAVTYKNILDDPVALKHMNTRLTQSRTPYKTLLEQGHIPLK